MYKLNINLKMTKSLLNFANEIIDLIFSNQNNTKDARIIGKNIYKIYGYKGLFNVINLVQEYLMNNEYSDEYLSDLRTLEFGFSGICDEFQA